MAMSQRFRERARDIFLGSPETERQVVDARRQSFQLLPKLSPEEMLARAASDYESAARIIGREVDSKHYLFKDDRSKLQRILTADKIRTPGLLKKLGISSERAFALGDCAVLSAYGDYVSSDYAPRRPETNDKGVLATARAVLLAAGSHMDVGNGDFRLPEYYFRPVTREGFTFNDAAELHPDVGNYGIEIVQAWVLNAALSPNATDSSDDTPRIQGSLSHIFGSFATTVGCLDITLETLGVPNELLADVPHRNDPFGLQVWAEFAHPGKSDGTDQALAQISDDFMARFEPGAQDVYTL